MQDKKFFLKKPFNVQDGIYKNSLFYLTSRLKHNGWKNTTFQTGIEVFSLYGFYLSSVVLIIILLAHEVCVTTCFHLILYD